jgi:aminopeptidase
MSWRTLVSCSCLILVVGACGAGENPASTSGAAPPPSVTPDLEAIAAAVVRSARIGEDDAVFVSGSPRDLELLENIITEAQKLGGTPLLLISTERIGSRYYAAVDERHDNRPGLTSRLLATVPNVLISVDAVETPDLFAHVPPARRQARSRAAQPFFVQSFQRGVRTVEIGNGLYPTHARAQQFGISRDELARYFWNGLAADPAMLLQRGEALKAILAGSREVRVAHPNGTDLTFRPDTRDIFINDGAISDADLAAGPGPGLSKYLPAGELYLRIMPSSARGRIVADAFVFQGTVIEGLTIDVANGEITSMTARSNIEPLLAAYGDVRDGREKLTIFDIGLNPGIPATPGSRVLSYVPEGMVTLFFGRDYWVGGSNTATFDIWPHLPGTTVTVDGRVIVENGQLRL